MNNIEKQRHHFEQIAEKYYEARQNSNHLYLKKLIWSLFLKDKNYLIKRPLIVLEPMCGYGEGRKILMEHLSAELDYEGFDYSENLVRIVTSEYPDINIYQEDITKFSPSKKYDLVILLGGLHHVPKHVSSVLSVLARCLNDGGYLINLEPTQNNFFLKKIRNYIYNRNDLFDSETEQAFDLNEINKYYFMNNFKVIDQVYPGLLSYVLYYNPDAFPLLNIGGNLLVKLFFSLDKLFIKNIVGRKLSFATLTLLQKQPNLEK